jgi:pre-rRNA-processing protein TSR3
MKTVILRHRRENLKKCSLTGLETHPEFAFYTYPAGKLPDLSHYLLLKVDAPPLTTADSRRGLFLIDATWRLAQTIEKNLPFKMEARSLPQGYKTAYPRRQTECPDPEAGLASIEALYLAHLLSGKNVEGILDHYYWKELFFSRNALTPNRADARSTCSRQESIFLPRQDLLQAPPMSLRH